MEEFLKKKKKIETLRGELENSRWWPRPLAPLPPPPLDCERGTRDKQHRRAPEVRLRAVACAQIRERGPYMKPRRGAHT